MADLLVFPELGFAGELTSAGIEGSRKSRVDFRAVGPAAWQQVAKTGEKETRPVNQDEIEGRRKNIKGRIQEAAGMLTGKEAGKKIKR